jgi:glycine cleavage system aminomethyltransferase T
VLFNQSYTWPVPSRPNALKLLSYLGVNSVAGFAVDKTKQFVPCSHDGCVIGDVVLFISRRTHSISSAASRCSAGSLSRHHGGTTRRRPRRAVRGALTRSISRIASRSGVERDN